MTKILTVVLVALSTIKGCNEAFFERPQPAGVEDLKNIPLKLRGEYFNLEDSSSLQITDVFVVKHEFRNFSIPKRELDSVEAKLYNRDTTFCQENGCFKLAFFGDSIAVEADFLDTLLLISKDNIIRKYGRYYFLNEKADENKWHVKKVELKNKNLILSSTTTGDDITALRNLMQTSDTVKVFNPSKKQLKKFIKESGFRSVEVFHKQ